MSAVQLDEALLQDLYAWIDLVPLSRPKKDLRRDFSDGVLVAEVLKHFLPSFVDLHNYPSTLAATKKLVNWHMLNRKVLSKLGYELGDDAIKCIVECQPNAIEQFLIHLRKKIEQHVVPRATSGRLHSDQPEADQDIPFADSSPLTRTTPTTRTTLQAVDHQLRKPQIGLNRNLNNSSEPAQFRTRSGASEAVKQIPFQVAQADERELLLQQKDENIQLLESKVKRLEHLIQLKDIRIEDLTTRLQNMEAITATQPIRQPIRQRRDK